MHIKRQHIVLSFIFAIVFVTFYSCDRTRLAEDWRDVEGLSWDLDSTYVFDFEIEDSTKTYNVNLGLRHLNIYPYRNIWVFSSLQGPGGMDFNDTIQYQLANKNGEWYGHRSAGIYSFVVRMYSSVIFNHSGKYSLKLSHGMRSDNLEGVAAVGVRIEENK